MDTTLLDFEGEVDRSIDLHNALVDAAHTLQGSGLTQELAIGAEALVPGILATHYGQNKEEGQRLGLENILKSAWDVILNILRVIRAQFQRMIDWLRGKKGLQDDTGGAGGGAEAIAEATKEVKNVITNDSELAKAIDEALKEAANAKPGMEDYFPYQNKDTTDYFETFRKSLSQPEVDFLTSGHRYKVLHHAVDDYAKAHFPAYIKNVERELTAWADEGLQKAPFIGKGEDAVDSFVMAQNKSYKQVMEKYHLQIAAARMLADDFPDGGQGGNPQHLYLFYKHPSELFPHLERLWKEIRFERMEDEDRELISALEDCVKRHDQIIQKYRSHATEAVQKGTEWPAEQEMLKLICVAHRESSKTVNDIVKVTNYIKRATMTAFTVTMKSFSYLIRVLTVVANMKGVNADKVKKSLDVIRERRKKLNDIITSIV